MSGADIQLEGGNWCRIHNRILEQLARLKLTGREASCIFFLLRMTYGNQVKEHEISLSLWAAGTNIDKRHVKGVLDGLIKRKIIYCHAGSQGRGKTSIYGINKYFEFWDSNEDMPSKVPEKVPPTVPIEESEKVPHSAPFESGKGTVCGNEKVPPTVPEKVPPTVPIKERSIKDPGFRSFRDRSVPAFRDRTEKPREQVALANDAGLTPRQLTAQTDALLDITGLRALVDAGHDRKLRDAQDAAILLAKLGYGDRDGLFGLHQRWLTENSWRSNKIPTLNNLMEFASLDQQRQTAAAVNTDTLDFSLDEVLI